jgi:hypothetical protein
MSATFIAAGPQIREGGTIRRMHNVDVAPTIMELLGVTPRQVDGEALHEIIKGGMRSSDLSHGR